MQLLTTENAKTIKGEKYGWKTGILYLASASNAGKNYNVCPYSDAACRASCLYTAGRGRFCDIQQARIRKTRWLFNERGAFLTQLKLDIQALIRSAKRENLRPAVRLNGTSDLPWYTPAYGEIVQQFPAVKFYDYTADIDAALALKQLLPDYYLTFSRKSDNVARCWQALEAGISVAVVFDTVPVGERLWGHRIISGDAHDLRFLDVKPGRKPVIVGLKAKGLARKENAGFSLRIAA